jgi:hypothetical protein
MLEGSLPDESSLSSLAVPLALEVLSDGRPVERQRRIASVVYAQRDTARSLQVSWVVQSAFALLQF